MIGRKVNLLTYNAVVTLQTSISAQIERQEPVSLEDVFGQVIPVHLEFVDSWEVSWRTLFVV